MQRNQPSGPIWIQRSSDGGWWRFDTCVAVVAVYDVGSVRAQFDAMVQRVEAEGLWAVGWVTYEAAQAFDPALPTGHPLEQPLTWFALCRPPVAARLPEAQPRDVSRDWDADIGREPFGEAIARIHAEIKQGNTYQVNYTHRLHAPAADDPFEQFLGITHSQRGWLGAYIDAGRWTVASASPELFFTLAAGELVSRPMKGTAARHPEPTLDLKRAAGLKHSRKNCAENLMIVDMLRNDMGRVAEAGSVEVPALLTVEQYPTVWQMTSTVQCRTAMDVSTVFGALFPCASITGAPKRRTMQLINELEPSPRGVYTGAIGYLAPGQRAQFNVAIRTIVTDRETGESTYGVGGGIVWNSEAGSEYEECRDKARVLSRPVKGFELLETLLWEPDTGFVLLERHLNRLKRSSRYFGVTFEREQVVRALGAAVAGTSQPVVVRLTLADDGAVALTTRGRPAPASVPVPLALADEPVSSEEIFLYHKTTQRSVYERARKSRPDFDDVLLWNERGEVTESAMANLVVELDGALVTPPVSSGLLAGTARAEMLECGEMQERVVKVEDLQRATGLWLVNSVRGKWRVRVASVHAGR